MEGEMAWYAKFDGVDGSSSSAGLSIAGSTDAVKADYMQYDMTELLVSHVSTGDGAFVGGFYVAAGDVNGDLDGRDFLVWQKNPAPETDSGLLLPAVQGELLPAVQGLLLPAVQHDFDLA